MLLQCTAHGRSGTFIDDRRSGGLVTLGCDWRIITDGVMGGLSSGELSLATIDNEACLRLQGELRLPRRGGQSPGGTGCRGYSGSRCLLGFVLEVYGNDQEYNVHLRTDDVWLPW